MPWINNHQYLETDLRHLPDISLSRRASYLIFCYQKNRRPEMPDIQPPIEAVETVREAFSRHLSIDTSFGRGGEKGREKIRLRKELLRLIDRWGDYFIGQVNAGRISFFLTGFEYFDLKLNRKPGPTATFFVVADQEKGLFRMSCQKKPAVLTWFHWEASEDNGATWIKLGKTRNPHHTTRKLDLKKPYSFRMYASNPKGKSLVAFRAYRGWG